MPTQDKVFDKFLAETDFSPDATQARVQEINDQRISLGLAPLPKGPPADAVEPPDVPSCDSCGKPYTAKLICSKCRLTWYCSKDCQRYAWKKQGHKQQCDGMKDHCDHLATSVVEQMGNTSSQPILRVQNLERLDAEGPYLRAKELGLNEIMYDMILEDTKEVQKRYRSNNPLERASFCVWIMTTLFRGGRIIQKEMGVDTNRYSDIARVKDFLYSKVDAFEVWWDASMAFCVDVVIDKQVFHNKPLHTEAHQMGRNILASWSQILTPPKAAKAILFGKHRSKRDLEKAKTRATFIAQSTKKTLGALNDKRDLRGVLEAYLNQNLAMVAYWCREFGVDVDMVKLVGLKGVQLKMYRNMAVPLAKGTIEKGSALNNQESQAVMMAARRG